MSPHEKRYIYQAISPGDAGNAGDDGQGGKAQGEDEGPGLESKVQAFSEKCELPCELSQSNVLLSELDKSALHQA